MKTFEIMKLLQEQGEVQTDISGYIASTLSVSKDEMDEVQLLEHYYRWKNRQIYLMSNKK